MHANRPAAWTVDDLRTDESWICELDDHARRDLTAAVRKIADPAKTLYDYRRDDFSLGSAWPVIAAAFNEVRHGTGFAILRDMPRDGLTQAEFELLTWASACTPASLGRRAKPASSCRRSGRCRAVPHPLAAPWASRRRAAPKRKIAAASGP